MPGDLNQPSKEMLDLENATVLKEARDPTKHLMTASEAQAFQSGQLEVERHDPKLQPITEGPHALVTPDQDPQPAPPPVAAPQQVPGVEAPQQPVPQQVQTQPPGPAMISDQQVPVNPNDSRPVQKRINSLYGKMRSAQEERDTAMQRIEELEGRLNQLSPVPAPPPAQNTFTLDTGLPVAASQPASPAGEDFVSRGELKNVMTDVVKTILGQTALTSAQTSSRQEVEQAYAQDLSDPEFVATMETALETDFRNDPRGPEKAAAMARGILAGRPDNLQPAAGATADTARRQALSSIGPSVAEGGVAPADDRVSRYNAAIEYAKRTGKDEDWARALRIKEGVE